MQLKFYEYKSSTLFLVWVGKSGSQAYVHDGYGQPWLCPWCSLYQVEVSETFSEQAKYG